MKLQSFLVTVLGILIISDTATAGESWCGSIHYQGNYYLCSNCGTEGNCVWWGYAQRPDLDPMCRGNAKEWYGDAEGYFNFGETPKVGSIACFNTLSSNGHVAYVQHVNDDGSFEVSEMMCGYFDGVRYYHYPAGYQQLTGFIYSGPVPFYEQRSVSGAINWREATLLTIYNPYSGHTSDHQPLVAFGSHDPWGQHWYHVYNVGSQDKFFSDGTPKNCYIQGYVGRSEGKDWDGAVVYDALGGAKSAYVIGWQQWDTWHVLLPFGDPEFNPGDGGPNSSLGMPITNSYWTGSAWRQDFQKGYLSYGTVHGYGDDGAQCAPGWSTSGWNHRYSYLFAEAYERNGAAVRVGKSFNKNGSNGKVMNYVGDYLIQYFNNGTNGEAAIIYDMKNWSDNSAATNEAYYISGNFYTTYTMSGGPGPWVLGAPTTDRFGNIQYFKYGRMEELAGGVVRAYDRNGICKWNCPVGAVGGPTPFFTGVDFDFDGDEIADYWDRTSTGEFHLDYASNNLTEWDTTFYGYGGSNDDPAPADYDGDGKYDMAILKNANSKWYIDYAADGFGAFEDSLPGYGTVNDFPCPCDYDGDGVADISVRDADGDWHIDYFAQGNGFGGWDVTYYGYGGTNDRPAPADFNGDGKCDFAILRNSDRKFLIDYAPGFGSWDVTNLGGYGGIADYPCPADYDNDGSDDIAVLNTTDRALRVDRTGNGFNGWDYVLGGYGGTGDRPMPADYDGDGWDDVATYYAAYDQICLDYASNNYGSWDWCDDGPLHPTWKVATQEEPATLPLEFSVSQNYPNPFNPVTNISYSLPQATHVTLEVYNILGQCVATLFNGDLPAGNHTSVWEADKQASGIYFYRLRTEDADVTKKMLLLK